MNPERGDCVATYLGLQGFKVLAVERVQHPHRGPVKLVRLERREGRYECPQCGRRHATGLFAEQEPILLRDCSIGDLETYLEVRPMRIACCGGTRVERLPFAAPGFRMTRRFFERLAALCTRLPVETVAQMAQLSWATVARVDGRAIKLALGDRSAALDGLRWIGVDEVSRTGGRVYFTIVTNLETGRVVWIGDGKGRKGLLPFLRALGAKGRRKIRGVVSDLGYRSIIAGRLRHAVHVLDRFHIVQWVNEALNEIRRRLFSGAPRDELGRTLKVKKWLLLSARENLEHKDKLLLNELMELNQPLYQSLPLEGAAARRAAAPVEVLRRAAGPPARLDPRRVRHRAARAGARGAPACRPSRRGHRRPRARRAARAVRGHQRQDRRAAQAGTWLPRPRVLQAQDLPALLAAGQPVGENRAMTPRNSERSHKSAGGRCAFVADISSQSSVVLSVTTQADSFELLLHLRRRRQQPFQVGARQ